MSSKPLRTVTMAAASTMRSTRATPILAHLRTSSGAVSLHVGAALSLMITASI